MLDFFIETEEITKETHAWPVFSSIKIAEVIMFFSSTLLLAFPPSLIFGADVACSYSQASISELFDIEYPYL